MNLSASAVSGLRAAQLSMDSAAHNIANLDTPGFRRQLAVNATAPGDQGVQTALRRADAPGNDEVADVVGQLGARNGFLANLAVFRRGDQALGSLIDLRG